VNALQLKAMVAQEKVIAPPQLMSTYPDALAPYAEPG
jgi:hypothetical protein